MESRRQGIDPVAVAHPHRVALARPPHALEQRARRGRLDRGAAELATVRGADPAPQLGAHGLLAVADAEDRHAAREHRPGRARREVVHRRRGSPGQDDRPQVGAGRRQRRFGAIERRDLAIDATFAHAPGDELRVLRTEIDHQDALGHGVTV